MVLRLWLVLGARLRARQAERRRLRQLRRDERRMKRDGRRMKSAKRRRVMQKAMLKQYNTLLRLRQRRRRILVIAKILSLTCVFNTLQVNKIRSMSVDGYFGRPQPQTRDLVTQPIV
uniref:Zgc:113227 n=1 Tax=Nothobranchius rachovii TaxID=451742 RepID=A0A1A8RPT7_9TELE